MKTKTEILGAKTYNKLFTSQTTYKKEYKELAKYWHPDANKDPDAEQIMAQINILYDQAKKADNKDIWGYFKSIEIQSTKIPYLYQEQTLWGNLYDCEDYIVYELNEKNYNLYLKNLSMIKFDHKKKEEYFSQFLPQIKQKISISNNLNYIFVNKPKDTYPMILVKDILSKKEHAAWVLTRLLNLCVLMNMDNEFSHNAITIQNCYVNLKEHSVMLYGGWQCGTEIGSKLTSMPKEIYQSLPDIVKQNKIGSSLIDLYGTKLLIQNLLGAHTYIDLKRLIKEPMAKFLMSTEIPQIDEFTEEEKLRFWPKNVANRNDPQTISNVYSTGLAFNELQKWEKVRSQTFPNHKFIKINDPGMDRVYNLI